MTDLPAEGRKKDAWTMRCEPPSRMWPIDLTTQDITRKFGDSRRLGSTHVSLESAGRIGDATV